MINQSDYIRFDVDKDVKTIAEALMAKAPGATKRSFMKGKGVGPGCYGEAGVLVTLDVPAKAINDIEYDIDFGGLKLEVKTKSTTVLNPPPLHYECSLVDYIAGKQDCDYYIFTRVAGVDGTFHRGWLLGYITPEEYLQKAQYMKKGQYDLRNRYVVRNNCYNLEIKDLHPISELRSKV